METDVLFFGSEKEGITSTSANHVANLAKEMIRGLEAELESLTLYSTSVSLIGSASTELLSQGAKTEEVDDIYRKLRTIAKAKSLIAWLREAIKARERMIRNIQSMTDEQYVIYKGLDPITEPRREQPMTEDEYYGAFSGNELNNYYELETLAAVLGKAIHPDGTVAEARNKLIDRLQHPRDVKGDGRDALIYSYAPTVDPQHVEEIFFNLQKKYRETQAKLNTIKFECEEMVKESEIEADTKYAAELQMANEYARRIRAERLAFIKERVREVSVYRIAIPDSLKDIYSEVSHLGKKK